MKKLIKLSAAAFILAMSAYLFMIIAKIDVLPTRYLVIILGIILFLNLVGHITLFMKKKWVKIFTVISYVFLMVLSFLGINYGLDTLDFLNKSFNNNTVEITSYELVVLKESDYKEVNDLINREIGYLDTDDNKDEVLKNLADKITFTEKSYDDIYNIYDDFANKKIDAMVVDDSILQILEDEKGQISDCKDCTFKDDYRIIYTFDVQNNVSKTSPKTAKLEPMNIYLSGSDSRSKTIQNKSRSDVNMILTINPDTHTVLMTSIPRDYYVQVHGQTGLKDKLTHAGIYGINKSRETVADLFDIKIPYSIKVSMASVTEIVDLVGGIDVVSDTAFRSSHYTGWNVVKGVNHMDGAHALAYSRERYAYASGDRHRILNQQQVLEAVLKKIVSDKNILMKYDKLLDSLSNFYRTDIPANLITDLAKKQIDDMSGWTFISNSVSGSDASLATYTAPKSKRYVMIPYEKDVDDAKNKIENVLDGKNA